MKIHISKPKPTVEKGTERYNVTHRDRDYTLLLRYIDPRQGLVIKLFLDNLAVALTALPHGQELYDYLINYWYPNQPNRTLQMLEKVTKISWKLVEQET